MQEPATTPTTAPPEAEPRAPVFGSNRSALLIVFLVVFIDLLGFGIVLPLLPLYATDLLLPLFGDEPGSHVLRGGILGTLMASFSFMQFLFAPIWGRLSDRIGRRPVLMISTAGAAISYAVFAIGSALSGHVALWVLLGSRVFAGICGANITVAQAYIADITPPDQRSK